MDRSAAAALPGAETIQVSVEGTTLTTSAAPDGSFVLNGVPEGYQTIVARTSGRAVAVAAHVRAGRPTDVGDLVLADAGQVSGLVSSAADGSPISGAHITVTPAVIANTDEVGPLPVRRAITDRHGSYTVAGLPSGDYVVTAEKRGFESGSLLVAITPGATTPGDIALKPGESAGVGTLEGVVSAASADGTVQPLAGALVRLGRGGPVEVLPVPDRVRDSAGNETTVGGGILPPDPCWYAYTDENGKYTIDGVPSGTYEASAVRAGFEPESRTVTIRSGAATQADFTLQPHVVRWGTVAGTVTDRATGTPIAGAFVAVRFMPPPIPVDGGPGPNGGAASGWAGMADFDLTAVTNRNGEYTLKAPAGDVALWVQANGYMLGDTTVTVPSGGVVRADIALEPVSTRTFTLKGVVAAKRSDGTLSPVEGARVIAGQINDPTTWPDRPISAYTAVTGPDGAFSFDVSAGEYYIMAAKDDMVCMPTNVNVTGDTDVRLVLDTFIGPGGGGGGRR